MKHPDRVVLNLKKSEAEELCGFLKDWNKDAGSDAVEKTIESIRKRIAKTLGKRANHPAPELSEEQKASIDKSTEELMDKVTA